MIMSLARVMVFRGGKANIQRVSVLLAFKYSGWPIAGTIFGNHRVYRTPT